MGRILAIDFGRKRTGLAVTDPLRITANPLVTIPTHTLEAWLTEYFSKEQVDEVVIGHPYQMSGEDSESMQYIQPFINRFRKVFPNMPLKEYAKAKVEIDKAYNNALPYFEKAYELEPDNYDYKRSLRSLYYRLGMNDKYEALAD